MPHRLDYALTCLAGSRVSDRNEKDSGTVKEFTEFVQETIVLFPRHSKASLTLYLSQGWLLIEQSMGKIALSHVPGLKAPEKPELACGVRR